MLVGRGAVELHGRGGVVRVLYRRLVGRAHVAVPALGRLSSLWHRPRMEVPRRGSASPGLTQGGRSRPELAPGAAEGGADRVGPPALIPVPRRRRRLASPPATPSPQRSLIVDSMSARPRSPRYLVLCAATRRQAHRARTARGRERVRARERCAQSLRAAVRGVARAVRMGDARAWGVGAWAVAASPSG